MLQHEETESKRHIFNGCSANHNIDKHIKQKGRRGIDKEYLANNWPYREIPTKVQQVLQ